MRRSLLPVILKSAMIETERLLLRPYVPEDLDLLAPILGDPITLRFWPEPKTRDEARAWIARSIASYAEHGYGRWAVILKESGEQIGDVGIMYSSVNGRMVHDLGYILHHPWWGKGYAVEAARAAMDHGFGTLGLDALHANMAHDNDPSRRVAERLGMTLIDEFANERNRGFRTFLFERRREE